MPAEKPPHELVADVGLMPADIGNSPDVRFPRLYDATRYLAALVGMTGLLMVINGGPEAHATKVVAAGCESLAEAPCYPATALTVVTLERPVPSAPPDTSAVAIPTTLPPAENEPPTTEPMASATTIPLNTLSPQNAVIRIMKGNDVSWPGPNCTATMPPGIAFGIVGLNHGKNNTANNDTVGSADDGTPITCLQHEIASFKLANPSIRVYPYLNSDNQGIDAARPYNGSPMTCADTDQECLAYDYGYNAGLNDFTLMDEADLLTGTVYIDVESGSKGNSWSKTNKAANVKSLEGQMDAINAELNKRQLPSANFIFYSNPYFWGDVTDDWQNGADMWLTTGKADEETALADCSGREFTGTDSATGRVGRTILVQYVNTVYDEYPGDGVDLDTDLTCPSSNTP